MQQTCECHCREMSDQEMYAQLKEAMRDYDYQASNLIQILHMAQAIFGYLPDVVQQFIA